MTDLKNFLDYYSKQKHNTLLTDEVFQSVFYTHPQHDLISQNALQLTSEFKEYLQTVKRHSKKRGNLSDEPKNTNEFEVRINSPTTTNPRLSLNEETFINAMVQMNNRSIDMIYLAVFLVLVNLTSDNQRVNLRYPYEYNPESVKSWLMEEKLKF